MTTHSPCFVQHMPLRDLRLVRLRGGQTEVAALPRYVVSDLPWNDSMDGFVRGQAGQVLFKDIPTGRVVARSWFPEATAENVIRFYRGDADAAAKAESVNRLRHDCRTLPTAEDEAELGFHCRRAMRRGSDSKRCYLHYLDDWPFHTHMDSLSRTSASAPGRAYPRCAQHPAFTTQSAVQPGDFAHKAAGGEDRLRAPAKARGPTPRTTRFFEHGVAQSLVSRICRPHADLGIRRGVTEADQVSWAKTERINVRGSSALALPPFPHRGCSHCARNPC
jgi:hypothetical protein